MSAIDTNPRVEADINESLGIAAKAGELKTASSNAKDADKEKAHEGVFRLTKITIILPGGGPMANVRVVGKRGGM